MSVTTRNPKSVADCGCPRPPKTTRGTWAGTSLRTTSPRRSLTCGAASARRSKGWTFSSGHSEFGPTSSRLTS